MTDDRRRRRHGATGWTPRDLGLGIAALAAASGIGNLAARVAGTTRGNRYPRPVQGSAEQRRRVRQQERLTREQTRRAS